MRSKIKQRALGVLVPAVCVVAFAQCDGFLETEPFGSLNTGTFYNTVGDFEAATVGAYSTFLNLTWSGRDQSIFESMLLPDDDTRGPGTDANSAFNWTANNGSIRLIWDQSFKGVMRANVILQQLDEAELLTDEQKARFAGEAKFVRAYFYFLLARTFGEVPLITEPAATVEQTRPGAAPASEIWNLIESDLRDAAESLPPSWPATETGRATSWAARALLGKVQLYRAQWLDEPAKYQDAIDNLQMVVDQGPFSLVPYQNNFQCTTENNAESIFEVQQSFGTDINGWAATDENGGGASAGSGRPLATGAGGGPTGTRAPGGWDWGDGGIIVTESLADAFETYGTATATIPETGVEVEVVARDPRAYYTFYSTGESYAGAPYNTRWQEDGSVSPWSVTGHTASKYIRPFEISSGGCMLNQSVSRNNERVIRLADVMLLLAEAKLLGNNDVAGAAELVNRVRERARNTWEAAYGEASPDAELYSVLERPENLLEDRPASVSVEQMFDWIRYERRAELALEIHRYDDLVRWLRADLIEPSEIDWGEAVAAQNFQVPRNLLRPIPEGELDLNPNLEQNPGY